MSGAYVASTFQDSGLIIDRFRTNRRHKGSARGSNPNIVDNAGPIRLMLTLYPDPAPWLSRWAIRPFLLHERAQHGLRSSVDISRAATRFVEAIAGFVDGSIDIAELRFDDAAMALRDIHFIPVRESIIMQAAALLRTAFATGGEIRIGDS